MIKNFFFITFLFITFTIGAQAFDISEISDEFILKQLSEDPTLIPMEMGALFVPYIVDSILEPKYAIFKKDEFVKDAQPGKRIPLFPGEYTIYVGSTPKDYQQKVEVFIEKERVTVVKPTWSAIIVETIDQYNNDIKESYQIINEKTKIQIGSGTGADILRGEKDQVWLLKPGLYRIAKRGESPYSLKNFVTARTVQGELSQIQIIFEDKTRAVLGGGEVINELEDRTYTGNWSFKGSISANFALVNTGYVSGENQSTNDFTLGSNINFNIIYDNESFLFINRLEINEQFQKLDKEKLKFLKDMAKFESSLIYRINEYFGPYISARVRTPFFYKYFKTPENSENLESERITVVEKDASETVLPDDSVFTYSKSFSTTTIQEGIGLNTSYSYGNIFQFTGRVGWGFRQDINPFAYDISKLEDENKITRIEYFNNSYGPEFYVYLSVFPLSFLQLKEEFDALLPVENIEAFSFLSKSSAYVWISSFAAIQYEFILEKSPYTLDSSTITSEHQLTVQVYYNFL